MGEFELPGGTTRWWAYGTDAPGESGTIVAVHGFRGDHHGLERVAGHLAGRRIVMPDLPGFGASDAFADRPHDIDGYARWVGEFLEALRPAGPVTLLGHSFGSVVVAAALAQGFAEASDLVLVNPIGAPALKGPKAIGTAAAVFYYWLAKALPAGAGNGLLRNRAIVRAMSIAMATTRDPELRRWIHAQHDAYFSLFADRSSLLEAFRASVSHDVSEYAARIRTRTLLVAAAQDQITPVAAERRLAGLFPDARLEVIDGVGHLIHYEKAAEAAALIESFLAAERAA
ncbi:alpha/beta fold hydrolase [Gryllotalpicola ginsengisoli]|uniref:alpha/beta fold hydrolase n=1 Tax=Gryllotalpicola ginsengisoli TaxID=444608 RepID=UPI0003B48780|nr:alpha/beta hydrolase [Gryllotalpicola ginsengisoli]